MKNELRDENGLIYFVGVWLDTEVHAQGVGFTKLMHYFCWGRTEEQAKDSVRAYLLGTGNVVSRFVSCSVAKQNLRSYTFPEQIIDLPDGTAVEVIQSMGYPEQITLNTMTTLRQRQQRLKTGRVLLQKQTLLLKSEC